MNRIVSAVPKLLLLLALLALTFFAQRYGLLQKTLQSLNALGPWAPLVFVAVYALACVFLIPSFFFAFGGGTLFGFWGIPLSLLGTGLGSAAAFLIGRTFARGLVAKKFENHKQFKALDAAAAKKGWQIVALARLSPVFPFSIGNYAFGLTRISLPAYFFASMLGTIPSASVYTYLGKVSGSLANAGNRERTPLEWALLIAGLIATIVLTVMIQRMAQKSLAETV